MAIETPILEACARVSANPDELKEKPFPGALEQARTMSKCRAQTTHTEAAGGPTGPPARSEEIGEDPAAKEVDNNMGTYGAPRPRKRKGTTIAGPMSKRPALDTSPLPTEGLATSEHIVATHTEVETAPCSYVAVACLSHVENDVGFFIFASTQGWFVCGPL